MTTPHRPADLPGEVARWAASWPRFFERTATLTDPADRVPDAPPPDPHEQLQRFASIGVYLSQRLIHIDDLVPPDNWASRALRGNGIALYYDPLTCSTLGVDTATGKAARLYATKAKP